MNYEDKDAIIAGGTLMQVGLAADINTQLTVHKFTYCV